MNPVLMQMSVLRGAAVTFSPDSGSYGFDSFSSGGTMSITASQPVVWNWTKSGTSTVSPANGATSSGFSVSYALKANGSISVTASLGGTQVGAWSISWNGSGA